MPTASLRSAFCATTVASGNWTEDCVKQLAGRDVIVLEDNDDVGRGKHGDLAALLHGTAKAIRVVSLPDLAHHGDVSDWLDADPRHAAKLADVCFSVPEWAPENNVAPRRQPASTELALAFINIGAWAGSAGAGATMDRERPGSPKWSRLLAVRGLSVNQFLHCN